MKKKIILLHLLAVAFFANAQYVGIGTATPLAKLHISSGASGNITPFSPLVVEGNNNTYINLLSPNANETAVLFGKANNAASGGIVYNNLNTLNGFQFRTNGNITRMVLDNNGSVGIGVTIPQATLDVNGNIKTSSLIISTGGAVSDFLIKNDAAGQVSFRKGHVALAINFIISLDGIFPPNSGPRPTYNDAIIGEIRMFAGNYAPIGWSFCQGQLLPVGGPNAALFALIGTTYGGDGVNNFALPDLRDAVPVSVGTNWSLGQRSN